MLHHSATVHVPLALAVLFPPAYVLFVVTIKSGWLPRRIWLLRFGTAIIQLAASAFAYRSGEQDRLMSPASEQLLAHHQQLALNFGFLWLGIAVLLPLAFLFHQKSWSRLLHLALLVLLAAQLWEAIQLGQLGGQIVFGSL